MPLCDQESSANRVWTNNTSIHWVWMLFFSKLCKKPSCANQVRIQKTSMNLGNQCKMSVNTSFTRNTRTLCSTGEKELWTASLVHRITYAGLVLNSGYARYTSWTLSTPKQLYPYMQSLLFQLVMYTIQSCSCIIVNSYWYKRLATYSSCYYL